MCIEIDIARSMNNEDIMQRFQNMEPCKKDNCKTLCIFFFYVDIFMFSSVLEFV